MDTFDKLRQADASMIEFAQQLIRTRSFSGHEREVAEFVQDRMRWLGYDDVRIDGIGNVVGRIGAIREPEILLDAHMDTVEVNDGDAWTVPPFGAEIHGENIYGRGAADMKSALAACVYAGAAARQALLESGRTAYVVCSVCEECCDGEGLRYALTEGGVHPRNVAICEPSNNQIMLGHRGKMQACITARGVSAHGATPQLGENAVYEMAGLVRRVEKRNAKLQNSGGGTLTLTSIRCTSASPNAVPDSCTIRLDRRLAFGETYQDAAAEMDLLVHGKQASWSYDELRMKSWTGHEIHYKPMHQPWRIATDHALTNLCAAAYQSALHGKAPVFGYWDFSTNAVAPISLGIPTIGFGPGDPAQAHTADEHCSISDILDARRFYTALLESSFCDDGGDCGRNEAQMREQSNS